MPLAKNDEPSRRRGRPRSQECHQAILRATVELLEARPYRDVTMERIAERAGVAKQTLYKWWPSKASLAMEAWAARMEALIKMPDTGSIEKDLESMLRQVCHTLSRGNQGQTLAGLIADAQSDPELAVAFRDSYIMRRRRACAAILQRAVERGELRRDVDAPLVLDLMYGPVWYRLLLRNAPLDGKFATGVVRSVLASIRAAS